MKSSDIAKNVCDTSASQMIAMVPQNKQTDWAEQNLLLVVHQLDPDASMESRLSWFRAIHAASCCETTLLCADVNSSALVKLARLVPRLKVVAVPHTRLEKLLTSRGLFYLSYRMWHHRVWQRARELHGIKPFTLVHQVSYCGYREPGRCWELGVPFVWGPLGGTQNVPWNFLANCGFPLSLREGLRNVVNTFQLRYSRRVRRALRTASCTIAANREVQTIFREIHNQDLSLCLETGIEHIPKVPQAKRKPDEPLKILWAGRLECWKGLPLLLKVLAQLPPDFPRQVRILGEGKQSKRWKKLASRLGVSNRIDWVDWPPYTSRFNHYAWADVFVFTSLRDTSGTGLLESLAAGVPVVGLDHQGARDIMTPDCAIAIPVSSPQQVVTDFSKALQRLAINPELLQRMSFQAQQRAHAFHWDVMGRRMINVYEKVLAQEVIQPKRSKVTNKLERSSASAAVVGEPVC